MLGVIRTMHLSIELLIENNSDEDIFVGDMNKGLAYWHIPSKGRLTNQLNNPNWFQLRVSNAYIYDNIERSPDWKQKVAYVSVAGSGYVEKKNVEYEDDYQIIYTNLDASLSNDSATEKEYILYNKETSVGVYNMAYPKFGKDNHFFLNMTLNDC